MIATQRLYLTADKRGVVGHNDPTAAFLLAGVNQTVTFEYEQAVADFEATGFGAVPDGAPSEALPADVVAMLLGPLTDEADDDQFGDDLGSEEKAVEAPPDKAVKAPANKAVKKPAAKK